MQIQQSGARPTAFGWSLWFLLGPLAFGTGSVGCKAPSDAPTTNSDTDGFDSDTSGDTAVVDSGDDHTDVPADTDPSDDGDSDASSTDSDTSVSDSDAGDSDDDSDLVPEGHWGVWPAARGCADMMVFASNEENTAAWVFNTYGYAESASTEGPQTASFDFGDDPEGATLRVLEGTSVTSTYCVGMRPEEEPEIVREWLPVSGTVELRVTPEGVGPWFAGFTPAVAEISLRDIALVPSDAPLTTPVLLGDQDVSVSVGWLPM